MYIEMYTMLLNSSSLPEIALPMPTVPECIWQHPLPDLDKYSIVPLILVYLYKYSPKLDELNYGFYDAAMRHQMKPLRLRQEHQWGLTMTSAFHSPTHY